MFADAAKEQIPSRWQLDDIFRNLIRKIATIAKAAAATDTEFDVDAKVEEVIAEYGAAVKPLILSQIKDFIESDDEQFYLKTVSDLGDVFDHVQGVDLDQHSNWAVSAFKGVVARFRDGRTFHIFGGRRCHSDAHRIRGSTAGSIGCCRVCGCFSRGHLGTTIEIDFAEIAYPN